MHFASCETFRAYTFTSFLLSASQSGMNLKWNGYRFLFSLQDIMMLLGLSAYIFRIYEFKHFNSFSMLEQVSTGRCNGWKTAADL